jgi:chromate transporter
MERKSSLREVGLLFLKLGTIAFGGPPVHIAMMQEEVVRRRKWIDEQHFLDLVGATNLIPGPNSTEMTMHCGFERAGKAGLFVAGACFILPAVLITGTLAYLYQQYGTLPAVQPFIYGIKPAVIAIVLAAAWSLGKKAIRNIPLLLLGIATLTAVLAGVNEIIALFAAGAIGILFYYGLQKRSALPLFFPFMLLQIMPMGTPSAMRIFFIFLKVGALLYGSGYVLLPFLEAELVTPGYLLQAQLIDAIAVGQVTPGPVLSTATFVGWGLGGFWGAVAATIGIFLPSFLFVWLLNPLVPRMRNSKPFAAFLDAVNVASVAVIVSACANMTRNAVQDWRTICILLLSIAVVLTWNKLNSVWIVIGGALLGYLLYWV